VRLVSIHGATTNAEPVPCTEGIPRRSLVRSSSSVIVSEWASVSGRCREIAGARSYPAWLPDSAPALGPSRNEPSASRKSSGRSICGRWPQSGMTTRRARRSRPTASRAWARGTPPDQTQERSCHIASHGDHVSRPCAINRAASAALAPACCPVHARNGDPSLLSVGPSRDRPWSNSGWFDRREGNRLIANSIPRAWADESSAAPSAHERAGRGGFAPTTRRGLPVVSWCTFLEKGVHPFHPVRVRHTIH